MDEVHDGPVVVLDLVCGVQPRERVEHDAQRDRARHRSLPVLLRGVPVEVTEVRAFDVLHDDVVRAVVVGAELDDRDDVRVMDARREPRLVGEHRHEAR